MQLFFLLGIRPRVLAGHLCDSNMSHHSPKGNRLSWSMIDAPSDINCLTLFILLTKEMKLMNCALPEELHKLKKVNTEGQVYQKFEWTDNKNLAVYQVHNLHLSTTQDPCNTGRYWSNAAEAAKRIATNHHEKHTNKKLICPQEQLFYWCTITLHLAAEQEIQTMDSMWGQQTSAEVLSNYLFISSCNSPQAQHKLNRCI